ncbi:MAG: Na+/H+ antiporter subunit E [Burkholderiales bacterium]|nr:Na+/H+ antiporter subunit E [Burkholderiales bacterium]
MKSWSSYVLLALALVALWLTLNQTLAAAQWLLAIPIAIAATWGYASLRPAHTPVRRVWVGLALAFAVLGDIVRSNFAVARIVIFARSRDRTAGFLDIPLELRNSLGLALLACIVTSTPGTSWARYDATAGVLTLHILDLIDEDAWIDLIKTRYERRLLEMFP